MHSHIPGGGPRPSKEKRRQAEATATRLRKRRGELAADVDQHLQAAAAALEEMRGGEQELRKVLKVVGQDPDPDSLAFALRGRISDLFGEFLPDRPTDQRRGDTLAQRDSLSPSRSG